MRKHVCARSRPTRWRIARDSDGTVDARTASSCGLAARAALAADAAAHRGRVGRDDALGLAADCVVERGAGQRAESLEVEVQLLGRDVVLHDAGPSSTRYATTLSSGASMLT